MAHLRAVPSPGLLLTGLGGPDTHNANYTFVTSDVGKLLRHTDSSAYTWTIDTYANQPIPAGQVILINNEGTGTLTIVAPSGGSLVLMDGSGSTGNRTVGAKSKATLTKRDGADSWDITGTSVT